MFSEKDFVNWLSMADKEKLRSMVGNDESLITYAKQFPHVVSMVRLAKPFVKYGMFNLDVNKIMGFLHANRPDVYAIVTRSWVQKQIDEFNSQIDYI